MAAAPIRRPLCSSATRPVLPCPVLFRGPIDGVRPALLAGILAAGGNAVEPDVPAVAMAEQGHVCKKKTLFQGPGRKSAETPLDVCYFMWCACAVL
jgi:hypothetical protein